MDSPGLFDTSFSHEVVATLLEKAVSNLHPGPHAILFVLQIHCRFTDEEFNTYKRLKTYFGERFVQHMVIVFTFGDAVADEGVSGVDCLREVSDDLQQVLRETGQRYVVFNNKSKDRKQVHRLLEVIRDIGGTYFTGDGVTGDSLSQRLREAARLEVARSEHCQHLEAERRKASRAQEQASIRAKRDKAATLQNQAERKWAESEIFEQQACLKRFRASERRKEADEKGRVAKRLSYPGSASYMFRFVTPGISTIDANDITSRFSEQRFEAYFLNDEAEELDQEARNLSDQADYLAREASRLEREAHKLFYAVLQSELGSFFARLFILLAPADRYESKS